MVELYVRKIKDGTYKFSKVPKLWKNKVLNEFNAELESGEISQEEYDKYISE